MFGSILPLLRMAGFGRKRRMGGRKMLIQGSGRRRTHRTHRMHGRGFFDTIKSLGSKALNLARSVPIISTGLKLAGQDKYGDAARSIGLGRRRRRTHRGGRMSVYGGRRRHYRKRRTRRYGGRRVGSRLRHRATKRRFSVFGGRKMRGGFLSSLVRGLLGGRRKRRIQARRRTRHRRVGGRRVGTKRTYRIGLFSRRR